MKILNIFFILLSVAGCTSLSKKDCEQANWHQLGQKDASHGKKNSLGKYQGQCSKFDVTINSSEYLEGYQLGLKAYCTYENGESVGLEGDDNNQICPLELKKEFNKGYSAGYKVYLLNQEKERLEQELAHQKQIAQNELEDQKRKARDQDQQSLESLKQCSSDSDCGPCRRCTTEYKTIGSASGHVSVCE